MADGFPRAFGRYDLTRELGRGAMGVVYEGFDLTLERSVAIKMMHAHLLDDPELRKRFWKEAQAVAALQHANIVTLYDFGKQDDKTFLIMEYVEGVTLRQHMEAQLDGRLTPEETTGIAAELLDALTYCHDKGVIHRDIKPVNIMLDNEGRLRILDFGVARLTAAASTLTGAVMGTPAYMAPEQIMGGRTDHRIDIFAAGCVIFEMLAGRRPFQGDLYQVYGQILHDEPDPPSSLAPGIGPAVDAVVLKALAKKPEDRFSSGRDLREALEAAVRAPSAPEGPNPGADTTASREAPGGVGARLDDPTSPLPKPDQGGDSSGRDRPLTPGKPRASVADVALLDDPTSPLPKPDQGGDSSGRDRPLTPGKPRASVAGVALAIVLGAVATGYAVAAGYADATLKARQASLREEQRLAAAKRDREVLAHRDRVVARGYPVTSVFQDCGDCPEMVVVPAGSFQMGSNTGDNDEKPVRTVKIGYSFAVGVYEVTFAEWDACKADRRCHNPSDEGWSNKPGSPERWGRGRRPVMNVSWDDAQQYVRWLSQKTGQTYRLLSEAEWEYVARAGTKTRFWWGDDIGSGQANCTGCGGPQDDRKTVPVGSFKANAFGLYDVHGNVLEWVEDCYHDNYQGAPEDGSAWHAFSCDGRVLRGGSWFNFPLLLRSANRIPSAPDYLSSNMGFRVARTLP